MNEYLSVPTCPQLFKYDSHKQISSVNTSIIIQYHLIKGWSMNELAYKYIKIKWFDKHHALT